MKIDATTKVLLGDLGKYIDSYPLLPKKDGPYTFETVDGYVLIRDRLGVARGHMPQDVYDDILKMEKQK